MHNPNSPLLVIGGNSYIGNYFSRYIQRQSPNRRVFAIRSSECNLLNVSEIEECFNRLPNLPFTVVFFAVVNKSVKNTYDSLTENQDIINNYMIAQNKIRIKSLVYVSSVDVYGYKPELPITEASPIIPDTWYGLAKLNCESMLRLKGMLPYPVTVLRIPGVFGDSQNDRSIIGKFARDLRTQGRVTITGEGKVLRDYVWVDDMSRLIEALIPQYYEGIVNGVTGKSYSLIEVATFVADVLGIPLRVEFEDANPERDFDLSFDNEVLKELLPTFEFSELRKGIASYLGEESRFALNAS